MLSVFIMANIFKICFNLPCQLKQVITIKKTYPEFRIGFFVL